MAKIPPDIEAVVREMREDASQRYQAELNLIDRVTAIMLRARMKRVNGSPPELVDDDATHAERIRRYLEGQPKGRLFGSKQIAKNTGLDVVAVRTALNKTRPSPFEKVQVGPRRVRWRLKDES